MTLRRAFRPHLGLALTLLAAPAAAQTASYSDAVTAPPTALASTYRLKLTSAWPQAAAGGEDDCRNGGDETVEGALQRGVDGVYRGSLDRRTVILFCGAHASGGEACALVLVGEGEVTMTGHAVPDETSPSGSALRLSWRPSASHASAVRGACSAGFKQAVERMYRSAVHGVEFAVPAAGAAPRTERLENYAWTVEVAGR